jgi:hypothetical protein
VRTFVPLLEAAQLDRLPARAHEVIEYRKNGLSLNHIQGCPLDCAYCIRHTYGLWDQRQPRALMTDAEAADQFVRVRAVPTPALRLVTKVYISRMNTTPAAVYGDLDRPHRRCILSSPDA